MPSTGYITVNAYTGIAQIPLSDVAIAVTADDRTALALRVTDRNGQIIPIELPVPEISAGQSPDSNEIPFTAVNLYARLDGYEQIENQSLQVFPDTVTHLQLKMIPLAELPDAWDQISIYRTPAQNL